MNDYILKLKFTQITLPPSQKIESRDFPRAKIRTTTPNCRSSLTDFGFKSRPQTPKPNKAVKRNTLLVKEKQKEAASKIKDSLDRRKSINEILESSYFSFRQSKDFKKIKNFRIKSPTKLVTIPYTSMKLGGHQ